MNGKQHKETGLAKFFEFGANQTGYGREFIAGLTTFLAMAYILFVNPNMLSGGELPPEVYDDMVAGGITFPTFEAVFLATGLAAVIGTLVMALFAKYPIALAPGMGLNAFFTYGVVISMGVPWDQALAGVFVSGIIFLILTASGIREKIINAIPQGLKYATAAGIGFFIAFIGFKNAGIVVSNPATYLALGDFRDSNTLLAIFGLVVTIILLTRRITGAIFYGIIMTTILGLIVGLIDPPNGIVRLPSDTSAIGALFGPLTDPSVMFTGTMLVVIFTFLFVDFFDTAGTLMGVATQANMLKDNKLPRAGKALASDSIATISGSVLGTSTTTAYIESAAGVGAGGRTGFAALVTAAFFLLALFFFPLLSIITAAVTAPALIVVGIMMASSLSKIEWGKIEEAIPAFLTVILMSLTFNIANGIALGFIVYPLTKLVRGQGRDVHPIMYVLFFIFLAYFIFLRE